jgi:hypothetical protein
VDGPDGFDQQMIGAMLERALESEMADRLGYERGEAPGRPRSAMVRTSLPA